MSMKMKFDCDGCGLEIVQSSVPETRFRPKEQNAYQLCAGCVRKWDKKYKVKDADEPATPRKARSR